MSWPPCNERSIKASQGLLRVTHRGGSNPRIWDPGALTIFAHNSTDS